MIYLVGVFLLCPLIFLFSLKGSSHGSAEWGRVSERSKKKSKKEAGSIILGKGSLGKSVYLSREEAVKHGVILGGSGTGKSRSFFLPNAKHLAGTSLVVTDPKNELWNHTSAFCSEAVRFAPLDPSNSVCFNWVPLCQDGRIAELSARAIVESGQTERTEQAWLDLETAFLAGLFAHAAVSEEPTPLTAYRLFSRQSQKVLLKQLLSSDSDIAREQAQIFLQTNERMRGSIVPVVASKLQFLRDEAVARFTSSSLSAPNFDRLREVPTALYWCLNERDISRLRPLTSVFFSLLLSQISHSKADVPITLLFDEFPSIGRIPDFETTIAMARGRGISLWLGVQSLSQLEANYGKANAQTILTNCSTKIALHGLDVTTGEYMSKSLGDSTVSNKRTSRHWFMGLLPSTQTTISQGEHARRLLTADEIRRIPEDRAIVITSNEKPYLVKKHQYNEPAIEKHIMGELGVARSLFIEPTDLMRLDSDLKIVFPEFPAKLLDIQ
jgi:type IV secretion system protein VirD4